MDAVENAEEELPRIVGRQMHEIFEVEATFVLAEEDFDELADLLRRSLF